MNDAKQVICPCCHAQVNPKMQVGLTAKALNIYAAAPDLLEACKAALSCMAHTRKECLVLLPSEEWTLERGNYREDCKCEIATVRATIRKAEGK